VYGWAPVRIGVKVKIPEGITTWIYPHSENVHTHWIDVLFCFVLNYVVFFFSFSGIIWVLYFMSFLCVLGRARTL
jgi:hypothetical protein